MKKICAFNSQHIPYALSNFFSRRDAEDVRLKLEKAKTAKAFLKIVQDNSFVYNWDIVKDDADIIQLRGKDALNNVVYIRAEKEARKYQEQQINNCMYILQANGVPKESTYDVLNSIVFELTGKEIEE